MIQIVFFMVFLRDITPHERVFTLLPVRFATAGAVYDLAFLLIAAEIRAVTNRAYNTMSYS